MKVEVHQLQPGDILLDLKDKPTVKDVQVIGPISIIDMTDNTATPPVPSRCVANIERPEEREIHEGPS